MSRYGGRAVQAFTRQVLAEYGRTCHLCGLPGATTADHVIPRAAGGPHTVANARPAHGYCNSRRQDTPLAEYLARYPPQVFAPTTPPTRSW